MLWSSPLPTGFTASGGNKNNFNWFPNALSIDSAGNICVGGIVSTNANDAALIKYPPAGGSPTWMQTLGSSSAEKVISLAIASDDTVYMDGTSAGQLPQQPASAHGGGFELHYGADGTLLSTVQSTSLLAGADYQVDSSGNAYLIVSATGAQTKWSSSGYGRGP